MTTFAVDEVKRATALLSAPLTSLKSISDKIGAKPESCSQLPDSLNFIDSYNKNSFIGAVHSAYADHYPLVLSPDMIWQCVAQGFATHVHKNAKKLRHLFVAHEGEKTIEVRDDTFVKGSPDNNWEGIFDKFSQAIREEIGDKLHGLLTPEFSTTGPVERAAAQVVLMDAFKDYFKYSLMTCCGIPEITLEGTVDDWKKLRDKTLSLAKFDFKWWTKAIKPVLDQFVDASSGKVDIAFWRAMYKRIDESGGPYITGWILTLFPYLGQTIESFYRNKNISDWKKRSSSEEVTTSSFPRGFVTTPFVWQCLEEKLDMNLYAGFMGVAQDKTTLSLRPVIGWAVVNKEEEEKADAQRKSRAAFWN